MGGIVSSTTHTAVSEDCSKFIQLFSDFVDPKEKAGRATWWSSLDFNGNGYVSLAEAGKWIKDQLMGDLGSDEGDRIYKLFYPSYIRAFKDAADIGKKKDVAGTKSATTDDYVTRGEFRLLLAYLCIYALFFDAFNFIDGKSEGTTADDDRRVSWSEFRGRVSKLAGHPLGSINAIAIAETQALKRAAFNAANGDGGDKILLSEWCAFLEKSEKSMDSLVGKLLAVGEDDTANEQAGGEEAAAAAK